MVLDGIIVLRLARADEPRRLRGIGGVNQADFGSLVVVNAEQQESAALRRAEAEKKPGVGLLMQDGVGGVGTDVATKHPARPVLVIEPDIEQGAAVGGPFERTIVIGDP